MSVSRQEIDSFIHEFEQDLAAFQKAYAALHRRMEELEGTGHARLFNHSSSVQAPIHALNLGIVSTEGILEDLKKQRESAPDRPALKLVGKGGPQ